MRRPDFEAFNTTGKDVKQLKSSLDSMPSLSPKEQKNKAPTPVGSQPVPPVRDVLPVQGVRRKIKSRHPFDIYEDQNETLKILSLEDRRRGGQGSMSAMVREALDDYIAKMREQGVL